MSHSLTTDLPFGSAAAKTAGREPSSAPGAPRCLRSEDLFAGHDNLVLIEHRGAIYRLHKTRLGKLILNK